MSEQFQRLMADHGIVCSMSRAGNVWDNAAMDSERHSECCVWDV
jgi:putative transposase